MYKCAAYEAKTDARAAFDLETWARRLESTHMRRLLVVDVDIANDRGHLAAQRNRPVIDTL
jgi:hypothetical protein